MGLFLHYIKLAIRNMWRSKSQTLISMIGLALGLTCFSVAMLWLVYEMSFDSSYKNSKRMYVIAAKEGWPYYEYINSFYRPLTSKLKETFPEIVNATALYPLTSPQDREVNIDEMKIPASIIWADSSFCKMFDVRIIEGSSDFLIPGIQKIAITHEKARQIFGNENPIGKRINGNEEICAIVSGMSKRSNYSFDFIRPFPDSEKSFSKTVIELLPGINMESFKKKLSEYDPKIYRAKNLSIIPITKLHYTIPVNKTAIPFKIILIFAVCGLLIIISSLFNYLTLFVSRFSIRQKELSLRRVFGATGGSLQAMLSVEFMLTMLSAVALGWTLIQLLHNPFLKISAISMNMSAIYRELLMYAGSVILISLFLFRFMLFLFQRRSMDASIRRSNKNVIRKISVIAQLVISIGFVFCVSVMMKQMHFLQHGGVGFSYKNRGSLSGAWREEGFDGNVLMNKLKQFPEVVEVLDAERLINLVPQQVSGEGATYSWDDKPADIEYIDIEYMYVSPEYLAFYEFQLIAGEMLTNADPYSMVLLNESAVKAFGWHDPVGKTFKIGSGDVTVKGVVRDTNNKGPSLPVNPTYYYKATPSEFLNISDNHFAMFKYREGMWQSLKEKIEMMVKNDGLNINRFEIVNAEEKYDIYIKSEKVLLKLLYCVLAVCLLICVFGLVALVSQTCAERRKSIAIRKINGANIENILVMFAKEYLLLLTIGAAVAFTAGYFIMQRWLENYVRQTTIPLWMYVAIIFAMALVIVLCVGWQVYRVSVENPAKVIKSE